MGKRKWKFMWIQSSKSEPDLWCPEHPYWIEQSHNKELPFDICTYIPKKENIKKYWNECEIIQSNLVHKIEFSQEFPKPNWFKEVIEKDNSKKNKMISFFKSFKGISK